MPGIDDRNIDWLRKRIWVPWSMALNWEENTGTSRSMSANSVIPAELGSLGMGGINALSAGAVVRFTTMVPYDLDPKHEMGVRVVFSGVPTGTATNTITFKGRYAINSLGEAITTMTAATHGTAFDTDFGAHQFVDQTGASTSTANKLQVSSTRGIISTASLALSRDNIEDGSLLSILIESDAVGAELTIGTVNVFGLWIDYVPQMTKGVGSVVDRSLKADGSA